MKAKVKATGKVVEVVKIIKYSEIPGTSFGTDYEYYKDEHNQKTYNEYELDFINVYPDWQQVRIQASIAAMQAMISRASLPYGNVNDCANDSVEYADALIEELKKTM